MPRLLIIGAGLSGATLAREFADAGLEVGVLESRAHPGGHCHTERDARTGVMMHVYGPHIFHSDDTGVWDFVSRFASFRAFEHTVKARVGDRTFPLPVTLHTLGAFYGRPFTPAEAETFVRSRAIQFDHPPRNFEEEALASIGPELYVAFFKGYTEKQWGRPPRELPSGVFKRLPLRFDENSNYFHHARIGIPENGYTDLIARALDHSQIEVEYGRRFSRKTRDANFDHVFYTGAIDAFFDFAYGRLPYRTLRFEHFRVAGEHQDTVCVNYPDAGVPFTRITEHKKLAPWEQHAASICSREYSSECGPDDTPFYPVNLAGGSTLLDRYFAAAKALDGFSFVGRLATFQYIDMDVAVSRARRAAKVALDCLASGTHIPALFEDS